MRRKSNLDTALFQIIEHIPPEEKAPVHQYEDTSVQFGASYYYTIQAGVKVDNDNPNATPKNSEPVLWSGRSYLPTSRFIEPPRGGSETLSDIIIAPNPYNVNDPRVQAQGWTDYRGIIFFNLPATVTIKIFTEDGDLIKTIEHDSPLKIGSLRWDMLTESQQVISSGVYIATFSKPDGEVAFRKFVVAR
ncbi:MAG: hypothetical protein U5R06_05440 [candidate division KSB1 bacterium]|nr:hypothetical protein [candidate division KSB1 bacterium]